MAVRTKMLGLIGLFATSALALTATQIEYSTVTGFFLQDVNSTNQTSFDYIATNLGLINQTYDTDSNWTTAGLTTWQRFERKIAQLNIHSPSNVQYKLLIMGRHGDGLHNDQESYVGTPAWNCYWASLPGNGTAIWQDAALSEVGKQQALANNQLMHRLLEENHMRAPDSYYTSPMQRCLQTAQLTYTGLHLPADKPFIPTVKEFLRESVSIHTCDWRSNKTWIHDNYPTYKFEKGFTEFDEIWDGVMSETDEAQRVRTKKLLDDIFINDDGLFISFTSHSGELGVVLEVVGHQNFGLSTGAIIPVLVKAETKEVDVTTTIATWTTSAHCTAPPITSISNGACVCPNSASPVATPLITVLAGVKAQATTQLF